MAEGKHIYATRLPPHIHSADSLPKRYWGQLAALVPVFVAACFSGHQEILRILLVCLVSALAFEFLASKFLRKKENLRTGEPLLSAALFSLLMPTRCPSEIVILGVFFATAVSKELFGGSGAYLFHPLFFSRAFMQICFPAIMTEPAILAGDGSLWTLLAVILGGIFFLKQKRGYWETPVIFLSICFFCEALLGGRGMPWAFFSGVLFTAFFLLADPVAMPLTRKGTALFVSGAAFLSAALGREGFSILTAAYAFLLMNLLTPWLDLWLKPVPYCSPGKLKATYFL